MSTIIDSKPEDLIPDILFSSASDLAQAQRISRLTKIGKLKQIRAGIYTTLVNSPVESVVQRSWKAIAEHLFPGAVIGYKTSIKGKPEDGKLFLVFGNRARRVELPGLEFVIVPGSPAVTGAGAATDVPYGGLFISSEPRRILENLSTSRGSSERSVGRDAVETELEKILSIRGEARINQLRDASRELAPKLGFEREFDTLNQIIGALLSTHDARILQSKSALARAAGIPYDPDRIQCFDTLFHALHAHMFDHPSDAAADGFGMENFAFFEAYFSNFIEGTEFTIEEAESIIFNGQIIENRSEDSHDVKGTFQAIISPQWRTFYPGSPENFLSGLKNINAIVMQSRPDKNPGEWKVRPSQAGSTLFVAPEKVPGTLREGFDRINALKDPVARALMTMFVISEVHPFADGNGRTARIAMNACLSKEGLSRIIIPTVYREDCLLPLKALSNHNDPAAYLTAMTKALAWSQSFEWYDERSVVVKALIDCNAFRDDLKNYKLIFPESRASMASLRANLDSPAAEGGGEIYFK